MSSNYIAPDDAYSVLTPAGALGAFFPDDGPVLWTGGERAKEYFADMLRTLVPPTGFGYTMDTLSETAMQEMVIPPQWSIVVLEPLPSAPVEQLASFVADKPVSPEDSPQWPDFNPVNLSS